MNWVKRLISFKHEGMKQKNNEWEISITKRFMVLSHPTRYRPIELWDRWGKMQANILSMFNQQWDNAHTYFWVQTYVPNSLTDVLIEGKYENVTSTNKDEQIFLFPDCRDQNSWETILSIMALGGLSRCIFILNNKPKNWGDIIIRLHQITQQISIGHSLSEFEKELEICHCLCGSSDEDLVIYKIDLEENAVLSILENIAKKEELELVIKRE